MNKLQYKIKPLTVAITSAILFASLASYAEGPQDGTGGGTGGSGDDTTPITNPVTEPNAKRIKQDYPLGTMTQWLQSEAETYALNPVNIRAGKHPDKSDPNNGPYDVVYIFPDAATANLWWDPIADPDGMPTTIPDDAVAFIHWVLDNGSGAFPGIMSKADIDGFKSKNCIMSSGATIPIPGVKDGVPKDCSNPQGSSKRFKMGVLKADEPIDLVYNVETAPLTYTNYDLDAGEGLPTHNGIEESGRIYRVLQKWQNATATDTANGIDNPGTRTVGFRLELGTGVGSAFTEIPQASTDGLQPDKALGFELRPCMADHFFDVKRDRPGTGTNDCSETFDTNITTEWPLGQPIPQEIWLEEEYSTFSPTMYSFNTDKRTTPVGGWWDKRPAGINPPATQTLGVLDSGTADSTVYYSDPRADGGTLNDTVYKGATTGNYFDITEAQAKNYVDDLIINPDLDALGDGVITLPGPFGYLMHLGVLAAGDSGVASWGIDVDEDGDPATEGDLIAWWDGDEYRWGSDPDVNGLIDDNAFTPVPRETLVEWAMFPLQEEVDPVTGEWRTGPLYELGVMDDLTGLNVDSFVYLGRQFTDNQFTIRLTAISVENGLGYSGGEVGNQTPAWVTTPPKALVDYISRDGVIAIRADIAGQPLIITLGDLLTGVAPTAVVENLRTGETENVTMLQDAANVPILPVYSVKLPTAANGNAGGSNDGTLNVWPLDIVLVTYIDEDNTTGAPVTRTASAEIPLETLEPVPPASDDSSGCSCSTSPDGSVDPILPAAILFALGFLGLRRWEAKRKQER